MKPVLCLPPAAALAIVGIWLGSQQRSIYALEKETQVLRGHLAAARYSGAADPSLAAARNGSRKTGDPNVIDWKALAATMAKGGGITNSQGMSLRKSFKAMSGLELRAALDEVAALGMGATARNELESWIFEAIKHKDPQLLMEHFFDRINDSRSSASWELPNAFQQWVGKDPAAAAAWFDKAIAAGKFESRSLDGQIKTRLNFEARLLPALLATDPDALNRRLAALPEAQRGDVFRQGGYIDLPPGSEKAFADLVREHVPENKRVIAFSSATRTMMLHQDGYGEVGRFLDAIEASPEDRREIAAKTADDQMQDLSGRNALDVAAVIEMRKWLTKESPGELETMTGQALARDGGVALPFEKRLKLIEEYHAQSGSDELLVSFLYGNRTGKNREASLALAAKISDATKRAEIIKKLSR
jgi:hypothetical protein